MTAGTCDLLILRLWNVAGVDYDLQGLRNNREHEGSSPMISPPTVNSGLPGLDSTRISFALAKKTLYR